MTSKSPHADVILRTAERCGCVRRGAEDAGALARVLRVALRAKPVLRFHGSRKVDERIVEPVLEPDWEERGALVGTLAEETPSSPWPSPTTCGSATRLTAEAAFAVADEHQRRGIGTGCSSNSRPGPRRSASSASSRASSRTTATCSASSTAAGFELRASWRAARSRCEFPIVSTEQYRETRRRARSHRRHRVVATVFEADAAWLSSARPAARVDRRRAVPEHARRGLHGSSVPGRPRRRRRSPACARTARSRRIPETVDSPCSAVPAERVLVAAEQALRSRRACARRHLGRVRRGRRRGLGTTAAAARARAGASGGRLIGPNCLGHAVAGPSLNATFAARFAASGDIGFSSQSGALAIAGARGCEARGLGLSSFVSIGNKADVSSNDLLESWEDDATTRVDPPLPGVLGNPRRFGQLARRVARRKPILALKSGTTTIGQRAARRTPPLWRVPTRPSRRCSARAE